MSFLQNVFNLWIEWKTLGLDGVSLSIGWGAIIGALATVAAGYLSRPSTSGLNNLASSEQLLADQRLRLTDRLEGLTGLPSAMAGILESGGFQLPRSLEDARDPDFNDLEGILESINFDALLERDALEGALGLIPSSSGATQALAGIQSRQNSIDDAAIGDFIENLVIGLMSRSNSPGLSPTSTPSTTSSFTPSVAF